MSDTDPMLPHAWLLDRLDRMEQRLLEHSRNVRSDMTAGFREVQAVIRDNDERARFLTDRVTIIETKHLVEANASIQHGAVAGVIGSGVIMLMVEAVKKWWLK
jgi:hypothetical protein